LAKLSGGVINIFVRKLVFAQSTRMTVDRQTEIGVTIGRSNTLSAYCNQLKNQEMTVTPEQYG
jgi:hypothetical protein